MQVADRSVSTDRSNPALATPQNVWTSLTHVVLARRVTSRHGAVNGISSEAIYLLSVLRLRKLRHREIPVGVIKRIRCCCDASIMAGCANVLLKSVDVPLSPSVMMAPRAKSRRHLRVAFVL